jgi:hypothetical protein
MKINELSTETLHVLLESLTLPIECDELGELYDKVQEELDSRRSQISLDELVGKSFRVELKENHKFTIIITSLNLVDEDPTLFFKFKIENKILNFKKYGSSRTGEEIVLDDGENYEVIINESGEIILIDGYSNRSKFAATEENGKEINF